MMSRILFGLVSLLVVFSMYAAQEPPKLEGKFILAGTDAKLSHVRAVRTALDAKGKPGYAILLSARPAEGDILPWQTADPAKRGSFIFLLLEKNGSVWVAELGHTAAKSGRFGVVTELKATGFEVRGDRLQARVQTSREEEFSGNHYTVDLKFDVPIEGKQ